MCVAAASAPASVLPTFISTTGLPAAAAAHRAPRSLSPSRQPSSAAQITAVCGSSTRAAMHSATSRSASLPVATERLSPMPRCAATAYTCEPKAPLCVTTPTRPGGGRRLSMSEEKVPKKASPGSRCPARWAR